MSTRIADDFAAIKAGMGQSFEQNREADDPMFAEVPYESFKEPRTTTWDGLFQTLIDSQMLAPKSAAPKIRTLSGSGPGIFTAIPNEQFLKHLNTHFAGVKAAPFLPGPLVTAETKDMVERGARVLWHALDHSFSPPTDCPFAELPKETQQRYKTAVREMLIALGVI